MIIGHHRPTPGFFDDFTGPKGSAPNPAHWSVSSVNWWGGTTSASAANAYLDGDSHLVLALTSTGGTYYSTVVSGYSAPADNDPVKLQFGYGTIEVNAKVSPVVGAWMLPLCLFGYDLPTAGWPACGEFDVAEFGLTGEGPASYYATIHGPGGAASDADNEVQEYVTGAAHGIDDFSTAYHTYWTTFSSDALSFGVDAITLANWTSADIPVGAQWDLNKNLVPCMMMGCFTGPSVAELPAYMYVDWVRWQPA